ncbi:MAG TPA: CPBP family intramembrane glutamic endopeptidase [Candidatus Saccharimonadales bacterium]|nr:CPBP family intramembrane glutamic endopeptidase [Candidatus Saccharimonadales bacterium]
MTKTAATAKKPVQSAKFPPWSPVVAIAVVIATYFLGSLIGELLPVFYALLVGYDVNGALAWLSSSTTARTVQVVIFYGSMIGLLYLFAKRHGVSFRQFGLVRPRLRDAGISLLAIVPYIAGYAVLLSAVLALFPELNTEQEQQLGFDPGRDPLALVLTFISLVVLPPLAEELTMRGFLFTSLAARMKVFWATLITSVVFAAAHLQFGSDAPLLWVAAIDTFVLSLILCYLRYKTGSLWAGIFLHALKNGVAFMALFVFAAH